VDLPQTRGLGVELALEVMGTIAGSRRDGGSGIF